MVWLWCISLDKCHNCFSLDIKQVGAGVEDGSKKWVFVCNKCDCVYHLWEFCDEAKDDGGVISKDQYPNYGDK